MIAYLATSLRKPLPADELTTITRLAAQRTRPGYADRPWSRAELLLAAREVPFRNDYNRGLRLDVMQAVIDEHRAKRDALPPLDAADGRYTADQCRLLAEAHGLTPANFSPSGRDWRGGQTWKYISGEVLAAGAAFDAQTEQHA